MKRLTTAAATTEEREFREHVVLANDRKSAGQLQNDAEAERPTGGGERCAEEFEVEKRDGTPFNRRTLFLTWAAASAAGRVENMKVAVTASCSDNWN